MLNIFYYALLLCAIPKSTVSLLNIDSDIYSVVKRQVTYTDNNATFKSNYLQNLPNYYFENYDNFESRTMKKRNIINKLNTFHPTDQTSFVIVFDATESMANDLEQLKYGVQKIVNKFTIDDNSPIYNYIFVPFREEDGKIGQ